MSGLSTTAKRIAGFPQRQSGVGLIEVLIALLVTAVGLLGLAALHGKAQQAEMESYQRSHALILLEDMANRVRTNRFALDCYDLGSAFVGAGAGSVPTGCDPVADADILAWHNQLQGAGETTAGAGNVGAMIGGRGCIRRDAGGNFVISVAWQGLVDSPVDTSAGSQDVRNTNTCGEGLYGAAGLRRVASISVRFAVLFP